MEERERIETWRSRLLQLDRRNRLLYCRRGKSSISITGIAPDELASRLLRSRNGLRFDHVLSPGRNASNIFNSDRSQDAEAAPRIVPGDISTSSEPSELRRRLRSLQRRDRTWEEEQGLNVLFLGIGFLNWIDQDGVKAQAPLLLLPCDLRRANPREAYRLIREDEDPITNPTLRYVLSTFGLELPEFNAAHASGAPIVEYIDAVRSAISAKGGWSVDAGIELGVFSHAKQAIYEDLGRIAERGFSNELARRMAGASSASQNGEAGAGGLPPDDLAGGRLDDLLHVGDQYAVLEADFSQLRAIELARAGGNLVIHGPPGTGKSQTIANIIASLLADGKKVLFVSEKSAALDVVKRRLEECSLGVLCLDLHSSRSRKSSVYEQLKRSLNDPRGRVGPELSLKALADRRNDLNAAVRKLHESRAPLGKSVYFVQGRFAQLRSHSRVTGLQIPPADEMSWDWATSAFEAAGRLSRHVESFDDDSARTWNPLRSGLRSIRISEQIREAGTQAAAAATKLRERRRELAEFVGLPPIESAAQSEDILGLTDLLAKCPGVPRGWLAPNALAARRQRAQDQEKAQFQRRDLEDELAAEFDGRPPPGDFVSAVRALDLDSAETEAIEFVFGDDWRRVAFTDPAESVDRTGLLDDRVQALARHANALFESLGGYLPQSMASIEDAIVLAKRLLQVKAAPRGWSDVSGRARALKLADEASAVTAAILKQQAFLEANFEESVVEYADEAMLVRYRTDHQSWLRRTFGSRFRRDQRLLQGIAKTAGKLSLEDSLNAVSAVVELKRALERWADLEKALAEALDARFQGWDTDFDRIRHDLESLDWFANFSSDPGNPPTLDGDVDSRAEVQALLAATERALEDFHDPGSGIFLAARRRSPVHIAVILERVRSARAALARVSDATADFFPGLLPQVRNFDSLRSVCGTGAELQELMAASKKEANSLLAEFGERYQGEETDWREVKAALDWTGEYLALLPGEPGDQGLAHAIDPLPASEYAAWRSRLESDQQAYAAAAEALGELFDIEKTPWESWLSAPPAELEAWLEPILGDVESAPAWLEYQEAIARTDRLLGTGGADRLRAAAKQPAAFPGMLERAVWESWLDGVYSAEPVLGRFSRVDQEMLRKKFRDLDRDLPLAARDRVRGKAFYVYPSAGGALLGSGQIGILNGEISKKRRQLSVRRLIATIPNLLLSLKPCFLMSPLAVSQFLPDNISDAGDRMFDTVVFDEASQVLPEDALPAIERAGQVIVVGDRQQLPPTLFFKRSRDESEASELEDEDIDDRLEGRESILDVQVGMVGTGATECHLGVHYRSRCESLIAFSNQRFYEDRLLTFPGPDPGAPKLSGKYLENATYDAGGSRQNRSEAEHAVQVALQLLTDSPRESVGIVALSRAQADLIEDLIERARLTRRDLDPQFDESLPERFFVKNLENVQGDERDHIILSIGYGPTRTGAVPNRFGPINFEGGERRLNVAITRARKSMTVFHSLRPQDITSSQPGPRLLRRFLEYARNPLLGPAEKNTGEVGEPESPFEEAVLRDLIERGHRVAAQVGESGYRIDLAIRSEQESGFDLGIECDGASYHSSPAARDRDWLRQQVLEGLGWNIHRVWSTSYIKNPKREIDAIEKALALARRGVLNPAKSQGPANRARPPETTEPDDSSLREHLFGQYRRFRGPKPRIKNFSSPEALLANLLTKIVRIEQPVHEDLAISRAGKFSPWPMESAERRRFRSWARKIIADEVAGGRFDRPESGFLVLAKRTVDSRPRRPGDGDESRPIGLMPVAELDAGLEMVARASYGIGRDELVREAARQFGWKRTGRRIQDALNERIRINLQQGSLREENGSITARS